MRCPRNGMKNRCFRLERQRRREELKSWLGDQEGLLSWKLDGLTIVLTYRNGELLVKAVTQRKRGSRRSHHTERQSFSGTYRCRIAYQGELILRGRSGHLLLGF